MLPVLHRTLLVGLSLSPLVHGLLLKDVHLKPHVPELPQFSQYGKSMVLGGGNLDENRAEIWNTIVQMAGGVGVAKIGVINAASADPIGSFIYYHDLFLLYGAKEVNRIPIDLNNLPNAEDQATIDLIYNQTGFFFGGGDQSRVITSFKTQNGDYTLALLALHQMFEAGAVIAGSSAGTTCQTANVMIKSGVSYDAIRLGSYPGHGISDGKDDEMIYEPNGGLGFMRGYVLDTHFSDRGREGRMLRLLYDTRALDEGTSYGIGVDSNTALVVKHAETHQMTGEVIGMSGVDFFDLSNANLINGTYFHITNVRNTYLTAHDVYHFLDHSVTFDHAKSPMLGNEEYADVLTGSDVFYGRRSSTRKPDFVRIATSVFDARHARTSYGTTAEKKPTFRVNMNATGSDAQGWVERKDDFHSDITSYKDLNIEILAI